MAEERTTTTGLPPKVMMALLLPEYIQADAPNGCDSSTRHNMQWPTSSTASISHRRSTSDSAALIGKTNLVTDESDVRFKNTSSKDAAASPNVVLQMPVMQNPVPPPSADSSSKDDGNEISSRDGSTAHRIDDLKRMKRVLANRLSAQKSRIRKMQYISELEQKVKSLQATIGILTPQIGYYDNQRLALSMENNAMKQRIAALTHDKLFKDAQFQKLLKDGEMLRELYIQQQQQQQLLQHLLMDDQLPNDPEI